MDARAANLLVEIMNDACIESKVYEDYSGRMMYGDTTTAVVYESHVDIKEFINDVIDRDLDGYLSDGEIEILRGVANDIRIDQLGLNMIAY